MLDRVGGESGKRNGQYQSEGDKFHIMRLQIRRTESRTDALVSVAHYYSYSA